MYSIKVVRGDGVTEMYATSFFRHFQCEEKEDCAFVIEMADSEGIMQEYLCEKSDVAYAMNSEGKTVEIVRWRDPSAKSVYSLD